MGFRKRSQYCINIQKPHPHPLPVGEGSKYPRFLLEDGARRPPSYYKPHPQPLPVGEGSKYPCFLLENRAQRPCSTMVCDTVINSLFAMPFTPLHKGRGKPRLRGAGEGLQLGGGASAWWRGFSLVEGLLFVIIRNIFSVYTYILLQIS